MSILSSTLAQDSVIDFQVIFDRMPGSFLILAPNTPHYTILAINDELLRVTAKKRQALVGKSILELYTGNQQALSSTAVSMVSSSLDDAVTHKKTSQMPALQLMMRNTEGVMEERYWSANNKPVVNNHGQIQYIIHSIIDSTDQVKSENQEAKIKGIEKAFHLFMQAPVIICIVKEPDYTIELANEGMLKLWGRTAEVVGKPLLKAVPELEGQGFIELLDEVRKTGKPYHTYENPSTLVRNGRQEVRYLNFIYHPYYENTSDIVATGVIGVAHDVTEQVLARRKVEESESRFRNMVKQAPVAITLTRGRDVVIENINTPMLRIMGKGNEEEMIGKKMTQVLPEVEGQPILEIARNVSDTGVGFRGKEVLINLMEGNKLVEHYFDISCTPLMEEGMLSGVLHVAIDVTEQVQARKKIEYSEQRLRSFMESAPFPIGIYIGKEMRIEFANRAILNIWGKEPNVIGKRYAEVLPELKDQEIFDQLNGVYTTGIPFHARNRQVKLLKDGKWQAYYLNYNFTPLFDIKGKVYGVMSMAADVTELNNALQQIEESKARLGAILQATPECIKIVSSDGTLQFMNAAGLGMIEGEETLLGNACVYGVIAPEHRAMWIENHKRVCEGESLSWEFDIIGLRGTRRRMETHAVPLAGAEGTAQLAVTRDITARKKSEEALSMKNAQLLRINNDLDNFIYTASHDLKAPISNIESLLHALLRTLPAENLSSNQVQRITSLMQDSVERFKKTIASLTEVVKLQKEDNVETSSIEISQVIWEVLLDLDPLIQASEAQVEIDIANCQVISFAYKNLRSIIYNLLSNGIKYRSPERVLQLRIHCVSTPDLHVLSVTDNGLGMQKRQVDKLFTMFKRFHDHVEGSGIGLYMVKKIVENAGGRIEVESKINVGSTFRIYLPN